MTAGEWSSSVPTMNTNHTTFRSARSAAELAAAAASTSREFDRMATASKANDHAAALREDKARAAAASLGLDFDAFMEAE